MTTEPTHDPGWAQGFRNRLRRAPTDTGSDRPVSIEAVAVETVSTDATLLEAVPADGEVDDVQRNGGGTSGAGESGAEEALGEDEGGTIHHLDEGLPEPTAGMVLHRVLAGAARTFLLNDMGDELNDPDKVCGTVGALDVFMRQRPVWASSTVGELDGSQRRISPVERIHQSRVSLRRIRSNLRTFRLLLDPAWGTALRAELAWYGGCLGELRDLHIVSDTVNRVGPDAIGMEELDRIQEVVEARTNAALAHIAAERGGARRFNLTEQMMVLWEGPAFKPKATKPAGEILPVMLRRAWNDLSSAGKRARKDPTNEHLHKVRIRVKNLRYGCNTVALVEGGPAGGTAKMAQELQTKLGDLNDALFAIDWFKALALHRPDLAMPLRELVAAEEVAARQARKGWKRELKEVERSWRAWQN
jgi:CHAD domain-containing protein